MKIMFRRLQTKDANGMYEWMSDEEITKYLKIKKENVSLKGCLEFIESSYEDSINKHFAITDENDEYLGTISLKNIDIINGNAEFAIALRKCAMNKGIAKRAIDLILNFAFEEISLHRVYWYVRSDNIRAVKFYEKCKYRNEGIWKQSVCINNAYIDTIWYAILAEEIVI